jgi:hypothetical protein
MKRIDLYDSIKAEAELILVSYGYDIDINDDDAIWDFVNVDLENDTMLEWDSKQTLIIYNYFLQKKAFSPIKVNIIAEYDTP